MLLSRGEVVVEVAGTCAEIGASGFLGSGVCGAIGNFGNLTAPVEGMRALEISQSMASLEMNRLASFLREKEVRLLMGSGFSSMVTEQMNLCSDILISVYTGPGWMPLPWWYSEGC